MNDLQITAFNAELALDSDDPAATDGPPPVHPADARDPKWGPTVTPAAIITDPAEIAAIRARITAAELPWWARAAARLERLTAWTARQPPARTDTVEARP